MKKSTTFFVLLKDIIARCPECGSFRVQCFVQGHDKTKGDIVCNSCGNHTEGENQPIAALINDWNERSYKRFDRPFMGVYKDKQYRFIEALICPKCGGKTFKHYHYPYHKKIDYKICTECEYTEGLPSCSVPK